MAVKHARDLPLETVMAGTSTSRQVLLGPDETPHDDVAEGDEPFEFLCLVPNERDEVRVL